MSILMMSKVWALENLEPAEKLVLLAVADFANDDGIAWPSIPTLARNPLISPDTSPNFSIYLNTSPYFAFFEGGTTRNSNHHAP